MTITTEDIRRAVAAADATTERDAMLAAAYAELKSLSGPYAGRRAREIMCEIRELEGADWRVATWDAMRARRAGR